MIKRPDMATLHIPARLQKLAESVPNPEEGFFGPDSLFWRVSRENSLLLGGASAALLQLAHPMVGAGVAKFSNFDTDPAGRFHRTFQIVYKITFGSTDEAIRVGAIAWHIHSQIQGELGEDAGRFKRGDTYNANEPELLLWVHATLVQQAILVYETFVAALSDEEKAQYYDESRLFAQLFGVPEKIIPPDLESFYAYFDDMVENVLGVEVEGMALRRAFLNSFPRSLLSPVSYLFAGKFLPPKTRVQYELPWNRVMELCFKALRFTLRHCLPLYPKRLRYVPDYLASTARLSQGIAKGAGRSALF